MTTLPPPLRGTSLYEGGKKDRRCLHWEIPKASLGEREVARRKP